jgi:hypothetical protein
MFGTKLYRTLKHTFCVQQLSFLKSCRLWDNIKNVVQRGRPQMTIWCMLIACWIPNATNTHSEYVILIAFPLQQWLYERALFLHYTYVACIVAVIHEPCCKTGHSIQYSNCCIVRYSNVQTCGSPSTGFGFFRPWSCVIVYNHIAIVAMYRGADKSLARPTSRCILFDGENISFDASLVICTNSTNIPPIMVMNRIYENQNLLSL